jgi:DNA replication protein DnaC
MKPSASLEDRAGALRLRGILSHLDEIAADENLLRSALRFLEWEEQADDEHRQRRLLKGTRLRDLEPLAGFDWTWPKSIPRAQIEDLFTLDFLAERTNVVFLGPSGVGKTTFAKNLVHEAARKGHSSMFVEAIEMLSDLLGEQTRSGVEKAIKKYARPKVLAIDEVGYLSYDSRHADLLLRVIQLRHKASSTIITTNRPFGEWREMFPNASSVVALVDRLTENCDVIQIDGPSYRGKRALERRTQRERKKGKGN